MYVCMYVDALKWHTSALAVRFQRASGCAQKISHRIRFAKRGCVGREGRGGGAGWPRRRVGARVASQLVEIISSLIASRVGGYVFSPLLRRFVSSRLPPVPCPPPPPPPGRPAIRFLGFLNAFSSNRVLNAFRRARAAASLASLSSFDPPATRRTRRASDVILINDQRG